MKLKIIDVITAKISDHQPVIHDGVLFWNVMMQGKVRMGREGISYNNGFGIIETDKDYLKRLKKIAQVIAGIIERHPSIDIISLCEGPIQSLHVNTLLQAMKDHSSMDKFFMYGVMENEFHQPEIKGFPNWGLLMLADKTYQVNKLEHDLIKDAPLFEKLANRLQLWQLTKDKNTKYLALAHFPFGGDEDKTEKNDLSTNGSSYCNLVTNLLKKYENEQFILCADFNLNPYLISQWNDRKLDQITNHNSIVLTQEEKSNVLTPKFVTVDGILLSLQEKQKYYSLRFNPSLFATLARENSLFISSFKEFKNRRACNIEELRDEQLAIVPYKKG